MANYGRRTWDREEYALLAEEDPIKHEELLKNTLSSTQLQQLKAKYTDHHRLIEESMDSLNKKVLATGINSYKKGKQFGFYCEICDLTFKDTAQYIDHLNHKTHQIRFESIFGEKLISDSRDNDEIPLEEFKREYKTLVNQFLRQHAPSGTRIASKSTIKTPKRVEEPKESSTLQKTMGFGSFGSTKN